MLRSLVTKRGGADFTFSGEAGYASYAVKIQTFNVSEENLAAYGDKIKTEFTDYADLGLDKAVYTLAEAKALCCDGKELSVAANKTLKAMLYSETYDFSFGGESSCRRAADKLPLRPSAKAISTDRNTSSRLRATVRSALTSALLFAEYTRVTIGAKTYEINAFEDKDVVVHRYVDGDGSYTYYLMVRAGIAFTEIDFLT